MSSIACHQSALYLFVTTLLYSRVPSELDVIVGRKEGAAQSHNCVVNCM